MSITGAVVDIAKPDNFPEKSSEKTTNEVEILAITKLVETQSKKVRSFAKKDFASILKFPSKVSSGGAALGIELNNKSGSSAGGTPKINLKNCDGKKVNDLTKSSKSRKMK